MDVMADAITNAGSGGAPATDAGTGRTHNALDCIGACAGDGGASGKRVTGGRGARMVGGSQGISASTGHYASPLWFGGKVVEFR